MKRIITLILTIFISSNLFSKNFSDETYISGTIKSKDGSVIEFATIYIEGTNNLAITDSNGAYKLAVAAGTHSVGVVMLGYKDWMETIEVKVGNPAIKHIVLETDIVRLAEVVVVGKSEATQLKERGFTVNVVDTRKESLSSLQTNDLLARSSGIQVRQEGGMGSDVNYNINGLSGNSVRIFIDGVPIANYGSSFSLSSIPPSMIERVELYKGVVPAHLSEDALGGAVNIVLKRQLGSNLSTAYSYGSFNTHKADFGGTYYSPKSGFMVGGSAFYNYSDNDYEVWGDQVKVTDPQTGRVEEVRARRFHDSYYSLGTTLNLGFADVKWADEFKVTGLYSKMRKDIQTGATMNVVYGNRFSRQETILGSLNYKKNNIVKGLDVTAFTSFSRNNRQVIDTIPYMYNWLGEVMVGRDGQPILWNKGGGEAGRATDAMNKENNFTGRYGVRYRFTDNHSLYANLLYNDFSRDVEDSFLSPLEQELTETRKMNKLVGSFAYEGRFVDERLSVSGFYKYYHQGVSLVDPVISGSSITPNKIDNSASDSGYGAALSYSVHNNFTVSLSGEKAIRLPESGELLGNTTANVLPTYDLKPEKSTNINLGLNAGNFALGDHSFGADVTIFYRDVNGLIQKSMTNLTDEMYGYENVGKVLSKGFDVDINYNWREKIFLNGAVSYVDARFNLRYDDYGVEYLYYGDRLRNAPYFTSNVGLRYIENNIFWRGSLLAVNYNFSYVHEFDRNWESLGGTGKDIIPSQFVHDIGVAYTFPNRQFTFAVDLRNIFNEQVFDNWALQKPGRAVYFKLTYNLQ